MRENYRNDNGVNVAVATESGVAVNEIRLGCLAGFAMTNHSCRAEEDEEGGGGGGVLISIHGEIPCGRQYETVTEVRGEMEHCSATVLPNYAYTRV